jgi:hypothetical protein
MTATTPGGPPATDHLGFFEERAATYEELAKLKGELSAADLVMRLRDGRAQVRINAALGLAVVGHGGRDLVPFLRDSEASVARATGEALVMLGRAQREHLAAIAAALDGARPEVVELVVHMFAELIGKADGDLVGVLDSADRSAAQAVVDACTRAGTRGLQLLQGAADDERFLVRLNAVRGIGRLAALDPTSAIGAMQRLATEDSVADVRATALVALAAYLARTRVEAAAAAGRPVASKVPELLTRALTPDEIKAAATGARLDELLAAIDDVKADVRLNAVRVLALQGTAAAPSVSALGVATRDPDRLIRLETVGALSTLSADGLPVAALLVRALGDLDLRVAAAAEAALAKMGPAAAAALVEGLDVSSEPHGVRVAKLIGKLPDGADRLREALASTSVDVRVYAAIGLGALGRARAGAVVAALNAATRGGNARVRAAVTTAIALLDPRPPAIPPPLPIAGFYERVLTEPELEAAKGALIAAGVAGLVPRLADVWAAVRANVALALGVVGGDVAGIADAMAVCLRDDEVSVRTSAARALARLGGPAVAACAAAIVRALAGAEPPLAALLVALLRAHDDPAIDAALVRGLDTSDDRVADTLLELICARPHAVELLAEAFDRPGGQAAAARGFVMLGASRLGRGRAILSRARIDPLPHIRSLATATLLAIDGPRAAPALPAIADFDRRLLEPREIAAVLDVGGLHALLADGRPLVRANAATALATMGPAAAGAAFSIAALLRDDDGRVRIAAARALDQLGDDTVVAMAPYLVAALAGDDALAEACRAVLASRKAQVAAALMAGLDTSDEVHGVRVAELIIALPDGRERLFAAFDGPAYNAQINAALGIGKLGSKRAGPEGRRRLLSGLPGPPTRRRDAMVKALAMLGPATDR